MELVALPSAAAPGPAGGLVRRYMSTRPAWVPGGDIQGADEPPPGLPKRTGFAFGGNVYAQSGHVACQAIADELGLRSTEQESTLGLHVSHAANPLPTFSSRLVEQLKPAPKHRLSPLPVPFATVGLCIY